VSHPAPWLALCLLTAGTATAQLQPTFRERQDRRTSLARTPTELRVAAGSVTTVILNGPLDRDGLVVDRTRFKWAEVSDHMINLQPFADLGSGERIVVKVTFKDRSVPAQAIFVVTTHPTEVDGTVEVDRRANTPEAMSAALAERDAQVEELKARCEMSGPIGVVRSGLVEDLKPTITFKAEVPSENKDSLEVPLSIGTESKNWSVSTFRLRNPEGQKVWTLGSPALIGADGKPVKVRSVWMEKPQLGPGEEGLLMVETGAPPWAAGGAFQLELPDREGARRLSVRIKKRESPKP
jgi:uncharacterized protein (TIGR02268 family)